MKNVGIVAIGRNEGGRLARCLDSVVGDANRVVYVDSGSTDDSIAIARARGVAVVELDRASPFTAARARNEGFARLKELLPELAYVQFLDGDCELGKSWLAEAIDFLEEHPDAGIVCGTLHEQFPERSIYNRLAELEWNSAAEGEVDAVGGIFMARRRSVDAVEGFDPTIAAGEEAELCARMRNKGWRLFRIGSAMAKHDLAITRFSQWWRRMVRFGYGSMDVAVRFGLERFRRYNVRARIWTAWLAAVIALPAAVAPFVGLSNAAILTAPLFIAWPAQMLRIALRTARQGRPIALSVAFAFFLMLSHWPQVLGQLLYVGDRLRRRSFRPFGYKSLSTLADRRQR